MAHPLIGTTWTPVKGGLPDITINSDADLKAHHKDLRDNYMPDKDYLFKRAGYSSTYLLAGVADSVQGLFLNTDKKNKQKLIAFNSQLTLVSSTVQLSGAVTGSYTQMTGSKSSKTSQAATLVISGPPTGKNKSHYTSSDEDAIKNIMMKKMKSPEKKCIKCGSRMTLLFMSFSCDAGCK